VRQGLSSAFVKQRPVFLLGKFQFRFEVHNLSVLPKRIGLKAASSPTRVGSGTTQ